MVGRKVVDVGGTSSVGVGNGERRRGDRGRGERGRGEQRSLPRRAAIVAAASGHQGRDVRGRG